MLAGVLCLTGTIDWDTWQVTIFTMYWPSSALIGSIVKILMHNLRVGDCVRYQHISVMDEPWCGRACRLNEDVVKA